MHDAIALTVDVEWAHPAVLADTVQLIESRGLRATFFCTHAGVEVPGHERALHPNFRRTGNTTVAPDVLRAAALDDLAFYRAALAAAQAWCPEARGVRAHSLISDSDLFPIYADAGLEYDSGCFLPLAPGLAPVWRGSGIVEMPLYYMDHWDVREQATGFAVDGLGLARPGLKVVTFHPNLVYLNAATPWLAAHRNSGRGVRTLFLSLLDRLAGHQTPLLSDVNAAWRAAPAGTHGSLVPR
jgi:hypothetical protein